MVATRCDIEVENAPHRDGRQWTLRSLLGVAISRYVLSYHLVNLVRQRSRTVGLPWRYWASGMRLASRFQICQQLDLYVH